MSGVEPPRFLDTSAIVKRYVQEVGTVWVQGLGDPALAPVLFMARISLAETVSAVTRRERSGSLTSADAAIALADFRYDFDRQYLIVEMSAAVIDRAAALARLHGLRGYDAVQLAAALEVRKQAPDLVLVSADVELNAAALAEGLLVEDPRNHP